MAFAVAGLGAWTYLLNEQLQSSRQQLTSAGDRLQVLEQRLSVTDESMSQSSVALQVKIKEMDGEIRKLWDNVWKRAKQDLAQHGKDIAALQAQLKTQQVLSDIQDSANALNTSNADLEKRVAGAEEWVDSFNGYRTQMNRKLLDLQGSITALQQP